jgi:hypothetical protein
MLAVFLTTGCGQTHEVTVKENLPHAASVELLDPPTKLLAGSDLAKIEVSSHLDNPEAGSKSYWLEVSWSIAEHKSTTAWGFVWRYGDQASWILELQNPEEVDGRWEYGPFRQELAAGYVHTLELRAIVRGRSDPSTSDRGSESHPTCPQDPWQCPLIKTLRIDLTAFK